MRRPRILLLGKVFVSAGLLLLLFILLDTQAVGRLLRGADPAWLLAAMTLTVFQVVLSAWRWRFTAGRLGMDLPMSHAVGEYYLATFLNQLLPGGIMGDASRAWRHGRSAGALGPALRAVILERVSGQAAMLIIAVPALLLSPALGVALWQRLSPGPWLLGLSLAVGVLGLLGLVLYLGPRRLREGLGGDVHRALLSPAALPLQLLSSLLVVFSYIAVFLMMARALGLDTSLMLLTPLVILLLLTMAVPVSIAGWGLREGVAVLLWPLAGLAVTEGVAVSVGYGLLLLVSSLPGALVLIRPQFAGREA